ncbi:GNAT family N-acetyltransferase [Sulfobacillus harzensis]|uniref:GNAT family N-acetyltransferase n=1 Tax=Sulfobacillus harzensis TaxID=2729629 RepID=A0A7Y0L3W1_9FIRM|nr:GNAT family N-acetyltransferase [Sulfobacillus harzensis]NMP22821.1 GNAT family N-acetyltransferase [Sulfobacillus harzensis]
MKPILLDFPQEFETERLLIRCPLPGDGAMVNEAIVESHEELKEWMPFAVNLPSIEETEENVRRAHAKFLLREDLRLHMIRKSSGRFVGSTGLHRINWDVGRFEIGYWIRTSEAGQGLVTEAVHGIVRWASDNLNAQRIEIRCDARNQRSRNVAERAGFHLEAILRQDEPDVEGLPSEPPSM